MRTNSDPDGNVFWGFMLIVGVTVWLAIASRCQAANEGIPRAVLVAASDRLVQIKAYDGSSGTGVLVGNGYAMTAGHVVSSSAGRSLRVNVQTVRGKWYWGRIECYQRDEPDCCLIKISDPPGLKPMPTAKTVAGETIYAAGWRHGTPPVWLTGTAILGRIGGWNVEWRGASPISGHSGGPVWNAKGEYLGPLWGGGGSARGGVFTPIGWFRKTQLAGRYLLPWNARSNAYVSGVAIGAASGQLRTVPSSGVVCGPSTASSGIVCTPSGCISSSRITPTITVRQGPQGVPGRDGVDGAQGPPGRGPTAEEIAAAVGAYLSMNPPAQGPPGPQGPPGQSPTSQDIERAVGDYLRRNPMRFQMSHEQLNGTTNTQTVIVRPSGEPIDTVTIRPDR